MGTKNKSKSYTNRELAEANVYPADSSLINEKEERDFWELRRKRFLEKSPEQKLFSNILQLKFQMEDYLNRNYYDSNTNFGYFLRNYIESLGKKNKEFAEEIDIKPAELSQLINNHRNPNNEILVRLEIHSNNNIPALIWYKLLEKDKEHYLMSDKEIRKEERKHVKRKLSFSL